MAATESREMIKTFVEANKRSLKEYFRSFTEAMRRRPCIAVIQIGENKSSEPYIKWKVKDGEEMGVDVVVKRYPGKLPSHALREVIYECNDDPSVDGVMTQLPLPDRFDAGIIMDRIHVSKDIGGLNTRTCCYPCAPLGVVSFLNALGIGMEGKNAVVIGRSETVGKPMADMLLLKDCSVTICHSKTPKEDLGRYVANADIIVTAAGERNLLTKDMVFKPSAVVMDAGANADEEGNLSGDCEPGLPVLFQSPVPGGVDLLTRLALFFNLRTLIDRKGKRRE